MMRTGMNILKTCSIHIRPRTYCSMYFQQFLKYYSQVYFAMTLIFYDLCADKQEVILVDFIFIQPDSIQPRLQTKNIHLQTYIFNSLIIICPLAASNMLQKKRDQFRKQIRTDQLDKFRQQKRKELQNTQMKSEIFFQVDNTFIKLDNILQATNKQILKKKHKPQRNQNNHSLLQSQETQICEQKWDFSGITQCFHKLKATAPVDYQTVFTKYIMDKKAAQRITTMLIDLVRNQQEQSGQESGKQQGDMTKYTQVTRNYTVLELVKFLDTIQYFAMGPVDSLFLIINAIWELLTDKILYNQQNDYGCLRYTLSVLGKMLQDTKNLTAYQYLSQKGIGNQILKFIDMFRMHQISVKTHHNLLKLIENYLVCQIAFPTQCPDKIGGVTIQTSSVNQKQIILIYCVIFIDRSQEFVYPTVFSAISKLFEIHEFLAGTFKEEYYFKITQLIFNPARNIQVQSLSLLNDFTFHSQDCIEALLKKGYFFDILQKRLMIEKQTHDQNVTSNVQKIAYMICNSLLTGDKKIRQACLNHFIWQQIYSSMHPSSKLFPLIMTMTYFFQAQGHKNFDKYFRPYLEALKLFDWQNCRYKQSINESIKRTFYQAQSQWQEHEYLLYLKITQQLGFLNIIEDLVEEEYLREIKGFQMQ